VRLRRALGVAFAPNGREVYAATADPGSLLAFDVSDSRLRPTAVRLDEGAATISEACAVSVSPDGEHVYVAGYRLSAIAWFRRGGGGASD
jgi:6-phosphogluconolactonase (cycloisomerase 2 family)